MPLPLGTGELSRRIAKAYATQGRIPLEIDSQVVPVVLIDDLTQGPGPIDVREGMTTGFGAAVVAELSYAGVRCARGMRLVIRQIAINNDSAAALDYDIRIGNAFVPDAQGLVFQSRGGVPGTSSLAAALVTGAQGVGIGFTIWRVRVPGNDTIIIPYLDILLDPLANPVASPPACVVMPGLVNTAVGASFIVVESAGVAR